MFDLRDERRILAAHVKQQRSSRRDINILTAFAVHEAVTERRFVRTDGRTRKRRTTFNRQRRVNQGSEDDGRVGSVQDSTQRRHCSLSAGSG